MYMINRIQVTIKNEYLVKVGDLKRVAIGLN